MLPNTENGESHRNAASRFLCFVRKNDIEAFSGGFIIRRRFHNERSRFEISDRIRRRIFESEIAHMRWFRIA